MSCEKEQLLIEKAKQGDIKAFEELIIEHEKTVYNIVYRMMNNVDDAYDLSQETFIKVYRQISSFDGKSKFSTWIYRIATNTCLDELRKRKGKETFSMNEMIESEDGQIISQYIDESENTEDKILDKEQAQIIRQALSEVNENYRIIITLRDINNLSYDEIAQILNISLGTVKSRISRARKEMKRILTQDKEPFSSYFRQRTRKEEKA